MAHRSMEPTQSHLHTPTKSLSRSKQSNHLQQSQAKNRE